MSVEDTLAERGARYGDFTDHAAVCQRIKMAMIAGAARWTRLPDTHKQALEVIADKIARILTGDPNYADNWHDIQGYAKLVEDRLPKTPDVYQQGEMIVVHTPEQRAAIYAALVAASDPEGGKISIHFGAQPKCAECLYPADAAGTHYATCSQLTAPEEYKAEAQVAFDEAAEISEALARQVSAGTIVEPAAAMDDDSPRMQAIGQNGEMGPEVYKAIDEAFAGAPEWAKYKAQDANGQWYWYECDVYAGSSQWLEAGESGRLDEAEGGEPNPNWRYTLVTRT